ncbi:MAG: SGNH/GDSL hydrolase family protein [Rhodothermaceae bacterium]|nr:SGNH/GDSL hydrolase family protein [Rhodothermaceae bacterium]MXZ56917.1 SGNH/GDSL hydrolase family protein [Rhodothermaceae bacterium]MYB91464.1 SGNH/GDSL hydrolase family protein [Rhodothermaceae bacterium]MYD67834.1 SGNH/GDSL hydrolase family protein [Rhodothermaceae bacterium]MYG43575.1 SGNH/GDSL hydrolase family protein [Rhodothermaceae bacterium]
MRTAVFKALAILMPLVLLVVVEGVVRLFGTDPFLIPVPGESEYQTVNPAYASRYFRGFVPQVAYNPFLKEKPDSVLRIVTLGGSSTAGYPYPFNSGFPERVAARLRSIEPTRQVEMINLGMTALSSHVLRDITPHVLQMKPDIVLIYAGHNEYYGAYGAGGPNRRRILTRTLFWFKKSVLFRRFERIISPPNESNRTMMAQSTTDVAITRDGPVYAAGIENFEKNLAAILRSLDRAGIQTYVGTLVSNLRGQPPLGVNSIANEAWEHGQESWVLGDTTAAMEAFVEAKEYDPIRFRAPEAMNQVINRLALDHGVIKVDTESFFADQVSDSLFTDHLHPTAFGYDLIAKAFIRAMEENVNVQGLDLGARDPSPLDAAYARLLIARLRLGFPFREGLTEEEEMRQFEQILEIHRESGSAADSLAALAVTIQLPIYEALLEARTRNLAILDTAQALAHTRSLLYWQPFNERMHVQAADLASRQSSNLAGEVMQLVVARQPSEINLNILAALRLRQGAFRAAGILLHQIESSYPESPVMLYNMARYLVLTGDTLNAEVYFRRYQRAAQSGR